jgi:hypothetical protein
MPKRTELHPMERIIVEHAHAGTKAMLDYLHDAGVPPQLLQGALQAGAQAIEQLGGDPHALTNTTSPDNMTAVAGGAPDVSALAAGGSPPAPAAAAAPGAASAPAAPTPAPAPAPQAAGLSALIPGA